MQMHCCTARLHIPLCYQAVAYRISETRALCTSPQPDNDLTLTSVRLSTSKSCQHPVARMNGQGYHFNLPGAPLPVMNFAQNMAQQGYTASDETPPPISQLKSVKLSVLSLLTVR